MNSVPYPAHPQWWWRNRRCRRSRSTWRCQAAREAWTSSNHHWPDICHCQEHNIPSTSDQPSKDLHLQIQVGCHVRVVCLGIEAGKPGLGCIVPTVLNIEPLLLGHLMWSMKCGCHPAKVPVEIWAFLGQGVGAGLVVEQEPCLGVDRDVNIEGYWDSASPDNSAADDPWVSQSHY